MSTEENKRVIWEFMARTQVGSTQDAGDFVSSDARIWLGGLGLVARDDIVVTWRDYDNCEILNMTAEGNRVAVEYIADTLRPDGSRYANSYHILFFLDAGKIVEMHEYCDTAYVNSLFPGRVKKRDIALRPTSDERWDGMAAVVAKKRAWVEGR